MLYLLYVKRPLTTWLIVSAVLCSSSTLSQNLSGVVNKYASVTAFDSAKAEVTISSAIVDSGDHVLIIVMQGATVDTSNSAQFGKLINYNGVGRYEVNQVCSRSGNKLLLKYRPLYDYKPSTTTVQLIKIAHHSDSIVVADTIKPSPWNGSTGGVVALMAPTINLKTAIVADGFGFRGADTFNDKVNDCSFLVRDDDYFYPFNGKGARRGEGIAYPLQSAKGTGRGALANGGGGGNDHNAGGGGGSLHAAGGDGGRNNEPGTFNCKGYAPGEGGYALSSSYLFLGGGGGAGHGNNKNKNYGGNGGGIVLLLSDTLRGNSTALVSSRGSAGGASKGDGAGGGGAGGSVIITATNSTTLQVNVAGGDGGNADGTNNNRCFGPGGGGSGGRVEANSSVTTTTTPGSSGKIINTTGSCTPDAENGQAGSSATNTTLSIAKTPTAVCCTPTLLAISGTFSICSGSSTILRIDNPEAGVTYTWNGSTVADTFRVDAVGEVYIEATNGSCITLDTVAITAALSPAVDLGPDKSICSGDSVMLSVPDSFAILWSTGDTTSSLTVTSIGKYFVTVTNSGGCKASDTIIITSALASAVDLGVDKSICSGDSVTLSVPDSFAILWSTGDTTSSITVTSTGTYFVTVTNSGGCKSSDTVVVTEGGSPGFNLPDTIYICKGGDTTLNGPPSGTFTWSDGSINQPFAVAAPGVYFITVKNTGGCSGTDTFRVLTKQTDSLILPEDTVLCEGDTFVLLAINGVNNLSNLLWSNGERTGSITVSQPGTYWLQALQNGCSVSDTVVVNSFSGISTIPDTIYLCGDSIFQLNKPPLVDSLAVKDSTSKTSYLIAQAGVYSYTLHVGSCSFTDSLIVLLSNSYKADLPDTISLCDRDSIRLVAATGADTYRWRAPSGTTIGSSYFASIRGWVYLQATLGGCTFRDSVYIIKHPSVNIAGRDTLVCSSSIEPITYTATAPADSFSWLLDGKEISTTSQAVVEKPGVLELISYNDSCTKLDRINITLKGDSLLEGLKDTVLCPYDTFLYSLDSGEFYLLNDDTVSAIAIRNPGTYVFARLGECRRVTTFTIRPCNEPEPIIPDAFSPDANGLNDTFSIIYERSFPATFRIFNRWGMMIYESPASQVKWDGYYNGKPSVEGAYMWILSGIGGYDYTRSGYLLLIR